MPRQKINPKRILEQLKVARIKYLLYNNTESTQSISGTVNPDTGSIVGQYLSLLVEKIKNYFDKVLWDASSSVFNDYPSMFVKVEPEVVVQNFTISIKIRAFVTMDGDNPHPIWYGRDQGIPTTFFPDGSSLFILQNNERTDNYRTAYDMYVSASPARRLDGSFAYRPGSTRPAQPGHHWSEQIADLINTDSELKNFSNSDWTVSVDLVPFSSGAF